MLLPLPCVCQNTPAFREPGCTSFFVSGKALVAGSKLARRSRTGAVVGIGSRDRGDADGFADSVELMVTGDLFDERVAIVFKQDEIPHVIQKQVRIELVSREGASGGFVTQRGQLTTTKPAASRLAVFHDCATFREAFFFQLVFQP